jgi:hypothetical protein
MISAIGRAKQVRCLPQALHDEQKVYKICTYYPKQYSMTKINIIIISIIVVVSHSLHIYLFTEITTMKVKGVQFYILASGIRSAGYSSLNYRGSSVFQI